MKEYLLSVVGPLIENPQAIEVSESDEEMSKVFTLKVSKKDMGRLLGKSGENIAAIRTLTRAAGARVGQKVSVRAIEPDN